LRGNAFSADFVGFDVADEGEDGCILLEAFTSTEGLLADAAAAAAAAILKRVALPPVFSTSSILEGGMFSASLPGPVEVDLFLLLPLFVILLLLPLLLLLLLLLPLLLLILVLLLMLLLLLLLTLLLLLRLLMFSADMEAVLDMHEDEDA
jgi:hypothetical protein